MLKRRNYKRDSRKTTTYVNLMNFTCAFPDCKKGTDVEGHHIIPLSKCGIDAFWNMIALCFDCHRHRGLHHNWLKWDVELYTWKCDHELRRFGFYLDEKEVDFKEKLKKAIFICFKEEEQRKFREVKPTEEYDNA